MDHIDAFISHNWVTKRFAKLFTLALYFNLRLALSLSLLAAMAMAALVAAGVVPTTRSYKLGSSTVEAEETLCTPWCKVASSDTS